MGAGLGACHFWGKSDRHFEGESDRHPRGESDRHPEYFKYDSSMIKGMINSYTE